MSITITVGKKETTWHAVQELWKEINTDARRIIQDANSVSIFLTFSVFRSSHQRCSIKVFLKISQNSQENTCARVSFLIKLQASSA